MYCQKCRAPLELDGSLETLNPAAFDLLIGATGKTLPEHGSNTSTNRTVYPQERQELYERVSQQSTSPVYRRSIPAPRQGVNARMGRAENGNMSFVMLTESQVVPHHAIPAANMGDVVGSGGAASSSQRPATGSGGENGEGDGSFSEQVERTAKLFEIVSARSDIDHPVCTECTEMLVDGLQKRLVSATRERDAYISFLKKLNSSVPTAEELEAAEQSLRETLAAEEAAYTELLELERDRAAVDEEIAALEEESRQLDLEEEQFWRDRNAFALTLGEFQKERDALNMRYDHDSRQLERLQRTNVYNDAFCIGHDGYFGTINGLRLGRLTNPSVEWPEINAAWGQTALLLATIAEKMGFQFRGYRLRPMGSTSRIDKVEYPQQSPTQPSAAAAGANATGHDQPKITPLDLFSSGDLPLNLPWLHRRFDAGMVAFLECLRQLGEFVESSPAPAASPRRGGGGGGHYHHQPTFTAPGLKLPYEIKRDKIGDASIKLGFNQNDETWTRACKYTLTCCKFLLAHASNVASTAASHSAAVAAAAVAAGEQARRR